MESLAHVHLHPVAGGILHPQVILKGGVPQFGPVQQVLEISLSLLYALHSLQYQGGIDKYDILAVGQLPLLVHTVPVFWS